MDVNDESPDWIAIAERSSFTSGRARLIVWAVAQLMLLFCIPLCAAGKGIEALVLGLLWILGTCWFCGAQKAVFVDVSARIVRYCRHVFGFPVFWRFFAIGDGDGLYLIFRLDSDADKGIHRLYLKHANNDFYLLDLPSDSPGKSSEIISLVQSVADRLSIYNYGYR
ncbi:hypothetical protein SH449x_003566 [Pirellulaceae bacterium SH449]